MKIHAFLIDKSGGPSVMKWREIDLAKPGRGEVLIRHTAVGFNFVDTYIRSGLYPSAPWPHGLGIEAAGVIEVLGPGVKHLKVGQRVAFAGGSHPGAYAQACIRKVSGLIKLPGWLDDKTAAAALTKGRTVEYLFNRTHKLKKGETILFHAAAGGVGLIACQWAKSIGATVIGTVSTAAKARLAKRHGCTYPVLTKDGNVVEEVMRLTKGEGVDVVYDSIGKSSWRASMESVKRLGLVVSFGAASGLPPPLDLATDGIRKSAYFTRATTLNYMTSDAIEQASARALFRMMRQGAVKIRIDQTYALKDAPKLHRDAEARRTTGSTVMLP